MCRRRAHVRRLAAGARAQRRVHRAATRDEEAASCVRSASSPRCALSPGVHTVCAPSGAGTDTGRLAADGGHSMGGRNSHRALAAWAPWVRARPAEDGGQHGCVACGLQRDRTLTLSARPPRLPLGGMARVPLERVRIGASTGGGGTHASSAAAVECLCIALRALLLPNEHPSRNASHRAAPVCGSTRDLARQAPHGLVSLWRSPCS